MIRYARSDLDEEFDVSIIIIYQTFPCLRETHDLLCFGRLNTKPGHGLMNLI